jgi:hypothetical protein
MYIIVNLYKGVAVRGGDPFSLHNIIKISFIFIAGFLIVILTKKIFHKEEKETVNGKAIDREDQAKLK